MKSKFQKILTSFIVRVWDGVFLHDLGGHEFDLVLGGGEGLGDLGDGGQGVHYRDVAQSLGDRQGCLSILQSNNIVSKSFSFLIELHSLKPHTCNNYMIEKGMISP